MSLFTTLLAFILTLGILIVFHEFGHYLLARLSGVKVVRFSIGFGKPLVAKRFKPDGTEWVLAAIPFGGYVKMLDEREGEVPENELGYAFNRKPVWKRMLIVAAGPFANFLLAIVLYWVVFMHGSQDLRAILAEPFPGTPAAMAGIHEGDVVKRAGDESITGWGDLRWALLSPALGRQAIDMQVLDREGHAQVRHLDMSQLSGEDLSKDFLKKLGIQILPFKEFPPAVGQILQQGPGAKAGLQSGDLIAAVNGDPVKTWLQLVDWIRSNPGKPVVLDIVRGDSKLRLSVTPEMTMEKGKPAGKIGIGPDAVVMVQYGPGRAIMESLAKSWDTAFLSLEMLWKMAIGEVSWKNLSGPITIADYAGQTAQMGWMPYIIFLAAISIGLGVLNLLPVPVLDGGHLMFYVAEVIKGSPVSERAMEIGQQIGVALLLTLMVFAMYNDISRLLIEK
jgi:regulator of sigma E protease